MAPAQTPPKREFRAVWVATVTNLDWPTTRGGDANAQKTQLTTLFDQLKATGISAVLFQVRPECDALYASPYEPWSYWLTGAQGAAPAPYYDPLTFAVDEAHKRGMELHAWFNPYRAERVVANYATAPSHVVNAHPDWILSFPSTNLKILNPGLPAVREFTARVVADIVRRYDVDGIHADDYFYPYDPIVSTEDAATFQNYGRGIANIGDWRRDNVNLLMKMIMDSVNAIKPYVKFGMSPFGIWKSGVPAGIVGLDAYSQIYGDAVAWLQQGTVDYLTPQLYWPFGGGQDYNKLMPWWADSVAAHGRHYYPGLAPYRISTWTAAELPNQLKLNRSNAKVGGEVYFRANNGITDNLKGFQDSLKNNFYRYPALHPVMAWKDVVPPFPVRAIRYGIRPGTTTAALQWDLPLQAPDGDYASRYAVYRFDHYPAKSELDDPRNMLGVEGLAYATPPIPSGSSPVYYVVTSLDRNYNEGDTSNVVVLSAPSMPVLASPADASTGLPDSIALRWRIHPAATQYRLQLSADSAFGGTLLADEVRTDTVRLFTSLAGQIPYYWRVKAAGAGGNGPFSNSFTFTLGTPGTVVQAFPNASMPDVPVNPVFKWLTAPGAVTYRFQLCYNTDFSTMVRDTTGLADTAFAVSGLQGFKIHFWRVRAINTTGLGPWSTTRSFRTVQVSDVTPEGGIPTAYALTQNYPNPFNPETRIGFEMPESGRVVLAVYDLLGREVAVLVNDNLPAGRYTATWNASSVSSGMYIYRMATGRFVATKRMMLVR